MKKWKLVLILGVALAMVAVFLPLILSVRNGSVTFRNIGRIIYR